MSWLSDNILPLQQGITESHPVGKKCVWIKDSPNNDVCRETREGMHIKLIEEMYIKLILEVHLYK